MSPKKPPKSTRQRGPRSTPAPAPATLTDIRRRLEAIRAIVYVCASSLEHECADNDVNVGLVLQRCVGEELDRWIKCIDVLAARCEKGAAS